MHLTTLLVNTKTYHCYRIYFCESPRLAGPMGDQERDVLSVNIDIKKSHLPEVLPLPLQNHFLVVLQKTTHAGSWMPQ